MSGEYTTLITSGAYIGEEMQAEFGRIPPAFLPVGSAYLVQHQLRYLKSRRYKWLSLPSDFELDVAQQRILDHENVSIVRVDANKSLGMSVFQSILEIDAGNPLEILHGDTLVMCADVPTPHNVFSVDMVREQYKWGIVETDDRRAISVRDGGKGDILTAQTLMLSGCFTFDDPWKLVKCLVSSDFSFIRAINEYAGQVSVLADRTLATLDFGHHKTFFASRKHLAATRHFNTLDMDSYVVTKRSHDKRKIDAEAYWLRSVPSELQPFTARLIEDADSRASGEYRTLYSSLPTVAELYLAKSSRLVWRKIMASCQDFLSKAYRYPAPERISPFPWLVIEKLRNRINSYPSFLPPSDRPLTINGITVGSLNCIVDRLEQSVLAAPLLAPCIMHGDFCFSNMLFDLRCDRILLIDPRGLIEDEMTVYGDIRYDIAKLGHSMLGRYDQIVAGHIVSERVNAGEFALTVPLDPLRDWLEEEFLASAVEEVSFDSEAVCATIISLFLAMIPLHSDDSNRQQTLFANALRLYVRFFGAS